jgi:hypothetical protein
MRLNAIRPQNAVAIRFHPSLWLWHFLPAGQTIEIVKSLATW